MKKKMYDLILKVRHKRAKYLKLRRIAKIIARIYEVSIIFERMYNHNNIGRGKREARNYHIFNNRINDFNYFIDAVGEEYADDYRDIENSIMQAGTLEECYQIYIKCELLKEKLMQKVPRYMLGKLSILVDDVLLPEIELMALILIIAGGMMIRYLINILFFR